MSKETYYFSHDYNARTDEKIKLLIRKHGLRGYGIFWAIVEDLYNNANALRMDCEGIAFELREDIETIKSVIQDFDLFQIKDNYFGSLSVQERLNKRLSKSAKARESVTKRWEKYKEDTNVLRAYEERNTIKESIVKENKEKDSKDIEVLKPRTDYEMCIEYWLKELHPTWTFTAIHGKTLKSIISKIKTMQKKAGKEITSETTCTAFKFICSNLPEFYIDKDLQVINSGFNTIIEEIKNKQNGTDKKQQQSKYR